MTTKADRARFDAFRRIGCVACRKLRITRDADVHHLLSGGKRRGHQYTIPLCPWHHRSQAFVSRAEAERVMGPSLALSPRKFRERFGSDEELLQYTNRLIASQ